MENQTKKIEAGETCQHYALCKKGNTLTCQRIGGACRDYMGTIIMKGLLYRCSCGFTDAIIEKENGSLVCTECGAVLSARSKEA